MHPRFTPTLKDGAPSLTQTVAACETCNFRKGSMSLRECGMRLQWMPYEPKVEWLR